MCVGDSFEKSGFFCLMMMMIDGSFAESFRKKVIAGGLFIGLLLHMLRLFLLRLVGFQCGHLFFFFMHCSWEFDFWSLAYLWGREFDIFFPLRSLLLLFKQDGLLD